LSRPGGGVRRGSHRHPSAPEPRRPRFSRRFAWALGQGERAAQLLAAADSLQAVHGFPGGLLTFRVDYAQRVVAARGQFTDAWVAGRAMPLDAAIAAALRMAREAAETVAQPSGAAHHAAWVSSADRPGGLTPRQIEILRLATNGKSNADIAGELVLSVRTVEKHLANIYDKLGVAGRVPATLYAVQHGLVPHEAVVG
jgi:DNA-binding CsgD family transcriptional regulator